MLLDGSFAVGAGGVWLPRTTCAGDGELPVATEVEEAAGVGDGDRAADAGADGVAAAAAVGVGADVGDGDEADADADAFRAAVGVGLAGLTATTPVEDAANTTAPRATRPASTAIGTRPIRLPRGRRSRQFGQKPETGVVT